MKIFEREISEYTLLNEYVVKGSVVLFGGSSDKNIPVCELKQSFGMNANMYNRSLSELSVKDAYDAYKAAVSSMEPECVILHLGEADVNEFSANKDEFVSFYRKLIEYIKKCDKKTRIAVVSLAGETEEISEINKILKNVADSEKVEFFDINKLGTFSAVSVKSIASFMYATGFTKKPLYDVVRLFYGYTNKQDTVPAHSTVVSMNPSFT